MEERRTLLCIVGKRWLRFLEFVYQSLYGGNSFANRHIAIVHKLDLIGAT